MSGAMIQFRFEDGPPTPAQAAAACGLEPEDLDPEFGIIPTDPTRNLYAVRVGPEAAGRARLPGGDGAEGVFSDPRIAPFGPPDP